MFCVYGANTANILEIEMTKMKGYEKNGENLPTENRQIDREQRIQKLRPPYPLWSVDRRGTRANYQTN